MAVYVYSVVEATHPLELQGLEGVGETPGPIRSVKAGPLVAVVSDAPPGLRPKRRDLAAHQAVQERLMSQGTVLPLQFGLTAEDDDAVRKALEDRGEEYATRFQALRGCTEYHLRAKEDEEALLRQVLTDSAEARRLNDEIRAGTGTPDLPLALGELVAREVQARQENLAAGIVHALRSLARDERSSPPRGEDFLNVSFLVDHADEERFRETGKKLAEQLGDGVDLRLRGPLPPYSFV